jgi:hypothetical protein
MIVAELLSSDDSMQICFHKFLYEIYFLEIFQIRRFEDIQNGDYVLVSKVAK